MGIYDLLHMSWKNLIRNGFRSMICILAIGVGVAGIILMLSFVTGIQTAVEKEMHNSELLQTNISLDQITGISQDDAKMLEDKINEMKELPYLEKILLRMKLNGYATIKIGGKEFYASIIAVKEENISAEKRFSFEDHQGAVFGLGGNTEKNLRDYLDARVGKEIQANIKIIFPSFENSKDHLDALFRIDGLVNETSNHLGQEFGRQNEFIMYIPFERMQDIEKQFLSYGIPTIWGEDQKELFLYTDAIEHAEMTWRALEKREGRINFQFQRLERARNYLLLGKLIFGILGAITLVSALVGIMNALMLSIKERTKEIGITKALGVKTSRIRLLYILESIYMGLIGSALGMILSRVLSNIINILYNRQGYGRSIGVYEISQVSLWLLVIGGGIGILTSMFAGMLPAKKAISIDTLNALNEE